MVCVAENIMRAARNSPNFSNSATVCGRWCPREPASTFANVQFKRLIIIGECMTLWQMSDNEALLRSPLAGVNRDSAQVCDAVLLGELTTNEYLSCVMFCA